MSITNKRILLWGSLFGMSAVVFSILLWEEFSPLYQESYPSPVPLSEGWAQAHGHFYLILVILGPSKAVSHVLIYVMMFIQWFLIGAGLRFIATPSKSKRKLTDD